MTVFSGVELEATVEGYEIPNWERKRGRNLAPHENATWQHQQTSIHSYIYELQPIFRVVFDLIELCVKEKGLTSGVG